MDDALVERVRWAAYDRLLANDSASAADLAADLEVPQANIDAVVDGLAAKGRVELDSSGRVVGAHGLTRSPSPHSLTMGGTGLHTWCALDAIGIPAAAGAHPP